MLTKSKGKINWTTNDQTWMSESVFGSTLAVASSSTRTLLFRRMARARQISCFSPTEKLDPLSRTSVSSPAWERKNIVEKTQLWTGMTNIDLEHMNQLVWSQVFHFRYGLCYSFDLSSIKEYEFVHYNEGWHKDSCGSP